MIQRCLRKSEKPKAVPWTAQRGVGRFYGAMSFLSGSPLDFLHDDVVCVLSKGTEIVRVRSEHCSAWLGQGDDERVDCGSSPCQRITDLLLDVARLEKAVQESIAARMPLQTLHKHDGGNQGRPQTLFAKRREQRCHLPRALGQTADSARIEHQHDGQPARRAGRRAIRRATVVA